MTETKDKCYVSGKISELSEEEFKENFRKASELVEAHGYEAVNPLEVIPGCEKLCGSLATFSDGTYQHTWACYMKYDILALLECQAIYLQPNWKESRGARVELDVARAIGLWILTDDGEGGLAS